MRDAFHEDLDRISDQLVEMTRLVSSAMSRATTALLDADITLAEQVIENDARIDALREELDMRAIDLLARQQPVATDLRIVVTAMRMSSDIERMGDLAERIVEKAGSIIAAKDAQAALTLEKDDDAMDDLHRELFARLADDTWPHGTETAVDITLVGRYYERFADHAVSVARRVIFLVTGEWEPEALTDHEEAEDGSEA